MQTYVIAQQILRVLNGFYPQTITLEQIMFSPFFEKVEVTEDQIRRSVAELMDAGYILNSTAETPALGCWYKLTNEGVRQITRFAKPDPMIWGKSALEGN